MQFYSNRANTLLTLFHFLGFHRRLKINASSSNLLLLVCCIPEAYSALLSRKLLRQFVSGSKLI